MQKQFLLKTLEMQPNIEQSASKYIFLVDNSDLVIMLCSLGTHAVLINREFTILDFQEVIENVIPGKTNIIDFTFCPCLSKYKNEIAINFLKKQGLFVCEDAWRIFYKHENLKRLEFVDELDKALKQFAQSREVQNKLIPCTDVEVMIEEVKQHLNFEIKYDVNGNEKSRKISQTVRNYEIVLERDSRFANRIKYDEFLRQIVLMGSVPWESDNNFRPWSSNDDAALFSLIQNDYGLNSRNDFFDSLKNVSNRNKFHPVREMLDSLKWDGKSYIKFLLPEYLGVEDSLYTYEVMKLFMLGAVARIYSPGCKYDYTMILQGLQGIGKSTFLQLLSLNDLWFNDSLDSLDSDKAAQSLTGSWIIELAELKSLARTAGGVDSVKRFLSATQDKYRIPYERRADVFLRQCVFAGTTNKSDFLQDETGNRRFLIIQTGVNKPTKSLFNEEVMTDIKGAWAEAVHIWKNERPKLILPDSCKEIAKQLQDESTSDDGKIGLIEAYLEGRSRVCAIEIWQEALGEQGRPAKWQATEINDIIASMPEWKKLGKAARFGKYGAQKGFQRITCTNKTLEESYSCADDFLPVTDVDIEKNPFI